ncbi:OmpH family outer membrane protein [Sporomusa acidovorans]|uniref:Outer membrane protein (OmpH-like) n=1 Tax=Sporomusa acidovorans (strain ATCC 49682 / DSM 3132 / Mol) TaxID=1123286 RepID=A0ABZ3J851_SPOA4|nr:OmpH family outer membrane protein [Sporomusa acidovorans]OZC16737.1 outer membrane protein (OmpH-like) [Sporomusa acidovorans DSM 3132]SDE04159.1 periplasmic chaperone for outer membrane proteins Skp [Sporomusa acidovorans]
MFIQKKKVYFALFITFLFTLTVGTALVQAAPQPASSVGYVDFLYLVNNHPDTPKANEELQSVREQAKKDFDAKSAGLGDKEKRELDLQLGQQIEQKRQELLKPIVDKISNAIKEVRTEKGLSVVLGKNVIVDGGVDITQDVLKKVTGK